jgi:hypothetical protein
MDCVVNTKTMIWIAAAAIAVGAASHCSAETPGVSSVGAAPANTLWRWIGIPQGIQKIRDVTVNRRGNFPGLERKPPLKRIGDPANLKSDNPAIKAAAEIKMAEDMKQQKIKAIKFLAEMGCGCYDKDGKITDALLAAMDDCTPDVRLAAIEAIEETAAGECCTKCGSTSCCSEKVTKRLSEIAYERDDTGCCLEPNAEVRAAAAKALNVCCPNRATGPIEEEIPELDEVEEEKEEIIGEGEEGAGETIQGEGDAEMIEAGESQPELPATSETPEADQADPPGGTEETIEDAVEDAIEDAAVNVSPSETLLRLDSAQVSPKTQKEEIEVGEVTIVGGMTIQPVKISPVNATEPVTEAGETVAVTLSDEADAEGAAAAIEVAAIEVKVEGGKNPAAEIPGPVLLPKPVALPIKAGASQLTRPKTRAMRVDSKPIARSVTREKVAATVVGVDHRSGRIYLRSGRHLSIGTSVTVYHEYLTGERLIGHLLVKEVNGYQATAVVTDKSSLAKIQAGDRAVCF